VQSKRQNLSRLLHTAYCFIQTDGLQPTASDFMTSGDESGGGKAQRKRSVKDKPRKPRMKRDQGDGDADVDTAPPGMPTCACGA